MLTFGSVERDAAWIAEVEKERRMLTDFEYGRLSGEEVDWRFRRFLRKHVQSHPFYQNPEYLDIISGSHDFDIYSLPILEKQQLRLWCERFRREYDTTGLFRVETSGTTGVPLFMYLDPDYYSSYFGQLLCLLDMVGIRDVAPGSVSIMNVSVFEHIPSYRILQPSVNYTYGHRTNVNARFWSSDEELLEYLSIKNPLVLRGMPSTLSYIVNMMNKRPGQYVIRPRILLSFAELLTDGARELLADAFGAPVLDEYGLTELGGVVGRQCMRMKGFHINGPHFKVEVVDDAGQPVEYGQAGEIIVSNLHNTCIPLVRYRTGDRGVLGFQGSCLCGRKSPVIERLDGRALTRFIDRWGGYYNPFNEYRRFLFLLPILQFQMVQSGDGSIHFYYRSEDSLEGHPVLEELREKILSRHSCSVVIVKKEKLFFSCKAKFQAFLRLESNMTMRDPHG